MSRLFSCVMGSVDSSPYTPRRKCILTEAGAMALGAGASVLGSLLGFGSSSSANSTNLQIARETNAQNYKMFQEQLAYNENMWNKQNEYNLPKHQAQRLLDAGINPATVFGNGAITPAGQLVAPQAPTMIGAHVNPYNFDLSGVGQAVNAFFQNQLIGKEAESKGLDNQAKQIDLHFKVSRILLDMKEQIGRIDKMLAETGKTKTERDFLLTQKRDLENHVKLFEENYEYFSERERLQNDVMKAQQGNLLADSTLKRVSANFTQVMANYYPKLTEAQISNLSATFSNIVADTQNKVREGKLTNARTTSQYIQNQLDRIDLVHERNRAGIEKGQKDIKELSDYIGGLIFDNLRFFKK